VGARPLINWRDGKAGFVGSSKRLIKGAVNLVYTATSAIVAIPEIVDGVLSTMTSDGFGTTGEITSNGDGIVSAMENNGIISIMTDYGDYALSTITTDGDGIASIM